MNKYIACLLAGLFMAPVAGCQSAGQSVPIDGVMGAAIDRETSRYMDKTDESQAQLALEYNKDRQARNWTNPNTGASFIITPTSTYRNVSGQNCRAFQTDIFVDNKKESALGTACRQPDDGTWKLMK